MSVNQSQPVSHLLRLNGLVRAHPRVRNPIYVCHGVPNRHKPWYSMYEYALLHGVRCKRGDHVGIGSNACTISHSSLSLVVTQPTSISLSIIWGASKGGLVHEDRICVFFVLHRPFRSRSAFELKQNKTKQNSLSRSGSGRILSKVCRFILINHRNGPHAHPPPPN
jgi:hypothetical protein